jgi:PBP1b-binding outer membrane lipoprotein LpoB
MRGPKTGLAAIDQLKEYASPIMKKYICILAGAALLAACEQKTETVAPATTPAPTTPPPAATDMTSPAATEAPAATTESPAGTEETPAESPTP